MKNYFENNRLLLNPNKTEVIIFDKKSRNRLSENIEILDSIIPVTDTVKVLGLSVQNDLTWKAHTESMIRNLQYRTGILKRLRSILTPKQLEIIAQGLIVSKLRYGLSVYSSLRFTESDKNSKESHKIQVLLNDVMRTLKGAKRKDKLHIEDLISEFPWGSYNRMALKTQICDTWKFINSSHRISEAITTEYSRKTRAEQLGLLKPTSKHPSDVINNFIYFYNNYLIANIKGCETLKDIKLLVDKNLGKIPI